MHHALEIQEILTNVFGHCHDLPTDLGSLARTCRGFKEPALDVLWEELDDLYPLVKCLPDVFHPLGVFRFETLEDKYTLSRPPTRTEWDTLRSYTRRIRSIRRFSSGILDHESLRILLNPPTIEPLFPNLISLVLFVGNPNWLEDSFESVPEFAPNIRCLTFDGGVAYNAFASNCIRRWRNLQTLICPRIALDMDALVHLSRLSTFSRLSFLLSSSPPISDSSFFFSNLHDLTLHSELWDPVSRFLFRTRLPALTKFTTFFDRCPSRLELSSFWASARTSNVDQTIEKLFLFQSIFSWSNVRSNTLLLGAEDLRPCMAFSNLHHIRLDIPWKVGLTDSELLALAPAWPKLGTLAINEQLGWNTQNGITPNGLLQLLHTCRLLSYIALAIDTREYIKLPPSESPAIPGWTFTPLLCMNVLDSKIEVESVSAVSAFFTGIALCAEFSLHAWECQGLQIPQGRKIYVDRWQDVSGRVNDAVSQRP